MSTRLVILGLLRDGDLHGYELKHIIEEHMGDWTNIAFGSIYFALGKLAEEGSVVAVETRREGSRPSRTVYRITDAGRQEFLRLLRALWEAPERKYYDIDIGMAFMKALSQEELLEFLHQRVNALQVTAEHVRSHRDQMLGQTKVPRSARVIFDHTLMHTEAELAWTRAVLADVEAGTLP